MSRLATAMVSKVPAAVSACSAIAYFILSEGIRNHLAMLWQAMHAIAEHVR